MRQTDEETKIAAYIVAEVLVQDIKTLEGRSGMVFIAPRLHTHGTALYAAEYVFSLLSPCIASLRTSDRKNARVYARFQLCERLFRRSLPHRAAIVSAFSIVAASRAKKAK